LHLEPVVKGVTSKSSKRTAKLEVHEQTLLTYEYTLRPFAVEVLKELSKNFSMMVYSSGSDYNAEVLAQIIENNAKMTLFPYALGRAFLKNERYKVRSKEVLQKILVKDGAYLMVGVNYDDFKEFESCSIPVLKFDPANKDDTCLLQLHQYLGERVLPLFEQKRPLSEAIIEDFNLSIEGYHE